MNRQLMAVIPLRRGGVGCSCRRRFEISLQSWKAQASSTRVDEEAIETSRMTTFAEGSQYRGHLETTPSPTRFARSQMP